jgi:hypothetical protein
MIHRKPDLIVPIHDRRRRRRILTLKNFGITVAVLALLFIGISIRSELRGRSLVSGEYGRLYGSEVPASEKVSRKPVERVNEANVADQVSADPFLVGSAAREQILRVDEPPTAVMPAAAVGVNEAASLRNSQGGLVIVGGAEGVKVVQTKRSDMPKLGGGFGRE